MSQLDHDPESPTEQAPATSLPSYESPLHLPPDTIYLNLARYTSINRLLTLLNCLWIHCLLLLDCSFALHLCFLINSLFSSYLLLLFIRFLVLGFLLLAVHAVSSSNVEEFRCRTYDSDNRLKFAPHKQLKVQLISVPSYTPTWNYLYFCLTDYQRVTHFTFSYHAHELNETLDYMSISSSVWFCFLFLFSMDHDNQAPQVAMHRSSSNSTSASHDWKFLCSPVW